METFDSKEWQSQELGTYMQNVMMHNDIAPHIDRILGIPDKDPFESFLNFLAFELTVKVFFKNFPAVGQIANLINIGSDAYQLYRAIDRGNANELKALKYNLFMSVMQFIPVLGAALKITLSKFIRKRKSAKDVSVVDEYLLETVEYVLLKCGQGSWNPADFLKDFFDATQIQEKLEEFKKTLETEKKRAALENQIYFDKVIEAIDFLKRNVKDISEYAMASIAIGIIASTARRNRLRRYSKTKQLIKQISGRLLSEHIKGGAAEHIGDHAILEYSGTLKKNWKSASKGDGYEHGKWIISPLNKWNNNPGKVSHSSLMHKLKPTSGATGIDGLFRVSPKKYIVAEYKGSLSNTLAALKVSLYKGLLNTTSSGKQMTPSWVIYRFNKIIKTIGLDKEIIADLSQINIKNYHSYITPLVVLVSFALNEKGVKAKIHLALACAAVYKTLADNLENNNNYNPSASENNTALRNSNIGVVENYLHSIHYEQTGIRKKRKTEIEIIQINNRWN